MSSHVLRAFRRGLDARAGYRARGSHGPARGAHLIARPSRGGQMLHLLYLVLLCGVVFGLTGGLLRFVDPSIALAAAVPAAAALGVALFALPVQILPALTLAILAFAPGRFIPNDGPFSAIPVLAILMGIWVFRRVFLGQAATLRGCLTPEGAAQGHGGAVRMGPRLAVCATALILLLWISFSALRAGQESSISWVMSVAVSILLPILVFDAREEARLLRGTFVVAGALVGIYALAEMVIGASPVYGVIYQVLGLTPGEDEALVFSVYRAQASFSHPLHLGAFLTIPAALGLGTWLSTGRTWHLVGGALAAGGVLASVSRGSLAAVAVAAALAVIIVPMARGGVTLRRWVVFVVLGAVAAVVVLVASPLTTRSQSMESEISGEVRERAFTVAIESARYGDWVGTGPATSGETSRLFDSIVIENSLLQLLISIGIPGLLLFLLFVCALVWHAWANRDPAVVMAIVAYVIAISAFNALDAVRNLHIVVGLLVILAMHAHAPAPREPAPPARRMSKAVAPDPVEAPTLFSRMGAPEDTVPQTGSPHAGASPRTALAPR